MSSRPRIAVVGASVRGVAFSLLNAGCDVVAADLFADADLVGMCSATTIENYPTGLAEWLTSTPCDAWLYTGALENYPDLVDHMAARRPLFGNKGDVLRRIRDPLLLQEVLRTAGLSYPQTQSCNGLHPGEGVWLHKTGQGGNGSGVSHLTDETEKNGYWQRRVAGMSGSAQYVAHRGGECILLGATRQLIGESWTGAGEFQYGGTLAPCNLPASVVAKLIHAGHALTTHFGLRGLFGVDFIFDGEHAWIIEVNPRVTAAAEVVERVSGVNLLAKHLREFGSNTANHTTAAVPAAGKVVLYAKRTLKVSKTLSEQLLTEAGRCDRPQLADIPHPQTDIAAGEPILSLFAEGDTIAAVEAQLRKQVATVERSLFRNLGDT